MTDYELATIVDPDLEEDQVTSAISTVEQIIGEQNGTVSSTDRWEKRRLAYPIAKKREGTHVFFRFSAEPAVLPEIKRRLGLSESIMRHMIVLLEAWDDVPVAVRGVPKSVAYQQAAPVEETPQPVEELLTSEPVEGEPITVAADSTEETAEPGEGASEETQSEAPTEPADEPVAAVDEEITSEETSPAETDDTPL